MTGVQTCALPIFPSVGLVVFGSGSAQALRSGCQISGSGGLGPAYRGVGYALYVPVEQMDTVQKYICGEACSPRLNKLSGSDWKLTKARAKVAIEEMAHELLETSAKRREKKGYSFQPDSEWQHDFESDFKYVETQDQLDAAEDIKRDMESEFAMDRLLCGDVGFEKTKIAKK